MKKITLLGLFILLSLLAACSTSSTPAPSGNVIPKQRFEPYPEEFQMLGLTNNFRAQARTCGAQQFAAAPALTWVEAVGDTSWFHSSDMSNADTESHVGASTVDRLKARGFDPGTTAELRKKTALPAGGQAPNPNDVFNAWKADATLCANLMNPAFTNMGAGMFGYYEGGNAVYWTQILTSPKANTPAPTLTINPTAATLTVGGAGMAFKATLTNSTTAITWNLTGPGVIGTSGASAFYLPPATGGAGTATLTATAGTLTATATITINAAAAPTLTVSPTTANATVGGAAIPLSATLTNSNATISWSVTGGGSVSNATGTTTSYTPPATGGATTATVTATAGTLTASATITINAAATPTLNVSPTTANVTVGGAAIPFTANLANSADTINWSLTGPGSISANTGATTNYTPPANGAGGTATLTATAGALTASATITVNAVPTLSISPTTSTVTVGDNPVVFNANLANSNDPIGFSLNGPGTFSFNGATATYTPPTTGGAGTATLTATAGALTASATITINAPPAPPALTVTPSTATAQVGGANVIITASTSQVTWSMTGPGIFSWGGSTFTYIPPTTGAGGTAIVTATSVPGGLTASATITVAPPPPPPAPDIQQFLTLINQFRSQPQTCFNGDTPQQMPAVPPVIFNDQLNQAAKAHSQDMADKNYFSHTGLDGSTFTTRAQAAGYTGFPNGENIAAGSNTPQGAFDMWKNSHAGHCQNMMSANANEIGLGFGFNANSDWQNYWTFMTGKR